MSVIIHDKDNGLMKDHEKGIKCSLCGYYLEQSEIRAEYLNGIISLSE
jgi:hypothetical protein